LGENEVYLNYAVPKGETLLRGVQQVDKCNYTIKDEREMLEKGLVSKSILL
jgi:hypothetical protein